ncbi:MAG: RNA-binding protein [Oscillatoria princeps RMCB-10]|nr:RNA-binding protein [Oscillatoria princeps RMCB-10]
MSDQSKMQRGQQWLEELLRLASLPATVTATLGPAGLEEADSYWLTIDETDLTPEQIEILIGPEGTVIDAIQYLANSTLNIGREEEEQASYTIDLHGYRVRRQAELREMAEAAADRARQTGKEIELKDLSAAERRQVHTFLKEWADLETYSRGQEPDRRLVVRLR